MLWNAAPQLLFAAGLGLAAPETPPSSDATPETPRDGFVTTRASALGVELAVQSFTLDNGLRVYIVEDHSTPTVAVHTAFEVGSQDEEDGRSGFAHLFEHMMFKGSENVPDGGYFKRILGTGGTMNAFTTSDITQYFAVVPSNHLETVLWLESDRMRSLVITDENFENQRNAVKEERAMRYENRPYAAALGEFSAQVWSGTGYGHTTIGTQADLTAAETKDVQRFFDTYYVPNNAVIAIVGDVDPLDVKAKIETHYGSIPKGPDRKKRANADHTQRKMEQQVEDPYARQPMYVLGWKTVPEDHPDRVALELLLTMLLRGDASVLTKVLVDEKTMAIASFPMGSAGGRNAGDEMVGFIPTPGVSFADVQAAVIDEIDKIKTRGVRDRQLTKAKNQWTVSTVEGLATNNGRALRIAQGALFEGDPLSAVRELEKMQAVTTKDIKRVAKQYLTDKWFTLEIVPKS